MRSDAPPVPGDPAAERHARHRRRLALACGGVVFIGGALVLVGWLADLMVLKSIRPGLANMKANTAILFVLSGTTLLELGRRRRSRRFGALGLACAGIVLTVGLLTAVQYALSIDFGIDQLVAHEASTSVTTPYPGRMAPLTALVFVVLGAGLSLAQRRRAPRVAQGAAVLALLVSGLCCLSYLYGGTSSQHVALFAPVAVHTGVLFLFLAFGLLCASPDVGMVASIGSTEVEGIVLRRLLPVGVVLPIAFGWLRLEGQRAGFYDTEFGLALYGLSNIVVLVTLVYWTASQLHRTDAERRQADLTLRESEARYRLLTEALPYMVWTMLPDRTMEFLNTRSSQFTGLSVEQVNREGSWRLIHPDDVPAMSAIVAGPLERGEAHDAEYRFRHHSGEYRWVVSRAVPLRNEAGALVKWVGSTEDIHDQKLAAIALSESEARYRLLLEGVPQLVWTCLPDGQCDYLSRQWVEYTGIPEAQQLGYAWSDAVHPDDRPALMERWQRAVSEGGPFDVEFRLRGGAGGYRWFKTRAVLYRREDGVSKWFGTCTDIHDEKMIESKLMTLNATLEARVAERTAALATNEALVRQFVKYSPAAIAMLDTDMRYLQMSDRWLTDYHLEGRDIAGLGHSAVSPDVPDAWKAIHQRVLTGTVERCDEDRFDRADGTTEWLQWECRPWFSAENVVGGIIMFTQIITARKLIEEQVRTSLREKEVLLKEIHHRVKNNLQIVSTLLDLQSEHTDDPQALTMFRESRGRVKSMALIHERLYRAHDVARVDFAEYTRQLADDLYRAYKASDDDVRLDVDIDIPALAMDIAIPCGLLLNELMSNCFKHAFVETGEGAIRVALYREGDATNVLIVSDTGPGFPAGTDFRHTTSFGLQLVVTLVDQLNGEISLVSDRGSTFTVRFPSPPPHVATGIVA